MPLPDRFVGKFQLERSVGFEEYLAAKGEHAPARHKRIRRELAAAQSARVFIVDENIHK
jgi:hypothetical protein